MRIGVVVRGQAPKAGGAHSFEQSVIQGLLGSVSRHQFVFLDLAGSLARSVSMPGVKIVDLSGLESAALPRGGAKSSVRGALRDATKAFGLQKHAQGLSRLANLLMETYRGPQPTEPGQLERAAIANRVDMVWFTHHGYPLRDTPYFSTVWDLAHRMLPFFPEVSHGGEWEVRERSYCRVLPSAAGVFVGTRAGKNQVSELYGVNPENVFVNPFVVSPVDNSDCLANDAALLKSLSLRPGFLFYPAQFWSHKNHVNLLYALQILESEFGEHRDLVLTGSDKGNLQYVKSVVTSLGLEERVHFLGFVSDDAIAALYRNAVAMVFPTFVGPDNIPPLEAFAHGCPVVASRVEGAEEQLGDAALIFDAASPEEMARQLAAVISDPMLRSKLVASGRDRVAKLTPEAYIGTALLAFDRFERIRRTWRPASFSDQGASSEARS